MGEAYIVMRRHSIFAVVCMGLVLVSISSSSVSVAFPVLMTDFNTNLVIAGWVLTSFQLVNTVIMPLAGKISETIGRKTLFAVCTLFFTVGSIVGALAPNIYILILGRVIQAIGGGAFMPVCAGIVSDTFPESRQRYIGLFTSIFPIGSIIGPNLGGWMVETFGWRSIFWFNVPLCLAVLALSLWLLQADRNKTRSSIDFTGAGLLFGTIAAFMFVLTEISNNTDGVNWPVVAVFVVLSICLMLLFLRREKHTATPIVDMELLKKKPFLAANIFNFIYGAGALGIASLVPLYLVEVYHVSILQSGVMLTARSIGAVVMSTITSFFLVRWGYRKPMLVGNLMIVVSLVLLGLRPAGAEGIAIFSAIPLMFGILGLSGLGTGATAPAANNACIELMPDKVATISGLRGMFRNLGSTVGITIATVIIHNFQNTALAFTVVFFALALILLIAIPTILNMPSSAEIKTF